MRIISQNRMLSVNFDNCIISISENIVMAVFENNNSTLGIYETSERAMQVFEDIHNAYNSVAIVSNLEQEESKLFIGSQNVKAKCIKLHENSFITTYDSIVYYMPHS